MAQFTTEQRELIFHLSYDGYFLTKKAYVMTIQDEINFQIPDLEAYLQELKDLFDSFHGKAFEYGIELDPNLPLDGTPQEILQFTDRQIEHVERYMDRREYTKIQYVVGKCVSKLVEFMRLHQCSPMNYERFLQNIDETIEALLESTDILDVDKCQLKGMLENIKENASSLDLDNVTRKLKILLCGGRLPSETQNEVKRSEVDTTRVITDGCWCVSLVRLPDRNAQHAFLVLEGKEGTKSMIWFTDFVAKEWFDTLRPGTQDGMVRIKHFESKESEDKLLFKCKSTLMDVGASDRLLFSSWLITKSTARRLIENIEEQANTPPKYHVLGDNSVAALSSGKSSSNPTGHNCFTFAKKMLRDLDDVHIQLPEDSLETWLFSATSRYLTDKRLLNRKWYEKPGYQMMAAFILGIVVAVALLKIG